MLAKEHGLAADLLEKVYPEMDAVFQTDVWYTWAQSLPKDILQVRPVLSVCYAWAALNIGDMETGSLWLDHVDQWLDQPDSSEKNVVVDEVQFAHLEGSINTARAYIAQANGDFPTSIVYAEKALDSIPDHALLRRGPAAALLGLAYLSHGELEKAHKTLADSMDGFEKTGNIPFSISGTYGLADIRLAQGRLRDALKHYERSLELAAGDTTMPGVTELYFGLGDIIRETGDLETAKKHLERSEELGKHSALQGSGYRFAKVKARFLEAYGELESALKHAEEAERLFVRTPVPEMRPASAEKVVLWLRLGNLQNAKQWAKEQQLSVEDELHFLKEFEHTTFARVLLTDGQVEQAIEFLNRLRDAAEAGGRNGSLLLIHILLALSHDKQGDQEQAKASLLQALELGEEEGYVRVFVDEGESLHRLLKAVQPEKPEYVGKILAGFSGTITPQKSAPSQESLVEPLSPRELEILQLIADGLSNAEISKTLFVALSTVKGHNRNIFGKLNVRRRTEAVARARELSLVQ